MPPIAVDCDASAGCCSVSSQYIQGDTTPRLAPYVEPAIGGPSEGAVLLLVWAAAGANCVVRAIASLPRRSGRPVNCEAAVALG